MLDRTGREDIAKLDNEVKNLGRNLNDKVPISKMVHAHYKLSIQFCCMYYIYLTANCTTTDVQSDG